VTMSDRLSQLLQIRRWLLADGATGTNLFAVGLVSGDAPELWNFEHPERIANLHRSFIEAGSDIVLTNSFGGNRYRLKLHNAETRVTEINVAAARIARGEADASHRPIVVAGSIGPTGEILAPIGPLSFDAAKAAYAEQAQALAQGGADVLWIETMSSREEVEAAIAGAATTSLPIVCTLSFDTNGRTMMGVTPKDLTTLISNTKPGLLACGTNCGVGPSEVVTCILNMANSAQHEAVLVAKANCGIPQYMDGAIRYNGTPELMAEYACLALDAGARIIGGCCGTTPEHIRAMRTALERHTLAPSPDLDTVVACLGEVSTGARAQWHGNEDRLAGAAPGANIERRRGRRRE
jgi:5-methyltetrahydrofolate--homocysteine methyltransferase